MQIAPNRFRSRFVLIVLLGLLAATPSFRAAELVNDTFADGDRGNSTGGDLLGPVWFKNGGTVSVVDDSAGIGTGNALSFTPSGDGQNLRAFFPLTTLIAAGDTIRMQFTTRFATAPGDLDYGFRFGLYNSNGTRQTNDTVGTTANDDKGYLTGTNAGAASSGKTWVHSEDIGSDILGGSPGGLSIFGAMGTSTVMGTTPHTAMLQITRKANGDLTVTTQIDSLAPATGTKAAASVLTYSFDEFAIGLAGTSNQPPFLLDNVVVKTISLPDISVSATDATATEGGDSGTFTFTRSSGTGPLTVNYTVTGTAVNGLDYTGLPGGVTFADGETSKDVVIAPVSDHYLDPSDTMTVTLATSVDYFVGSPSAATITITDATTTPVEYFPKSGVGSFFKISNGHETEFTKSTVTVSGQSFTQAMHVETTPAPVTPYDGGFGLQIWSSLAPAIANGDILVARVWSRSLNEDGSRAWAGVKLATGSDVDVGGFGYIAPGPAWHEDTIIFVASQAFAANTVKLKVFVGYGPEKIEIGGITVLNYGQVTLESLGLPLYEGREANAPWRAAAATRIEEHRKADLTVTVRDIHGNPIPGASVHAKMKRHAFGFGTAINSTTLLTDGANNQTYRNKAKQLFNWAVGESAWKWKIYEPTPSTAVNTLTWLVDNRISKVRGHNLIWPSWGQMPDDVQATYTSKLTNEGATAAKAWMRQRILDHITAEVIDFAGKLVAWDVLNEPYSHHDAMDVLGRAEMAAWFNAAHAADPGTQKFLNQDYPIMGNNLPVIRSTKNTIQEILDDGGAIHGLGLESHLGLNSTVAPERVLEMLDEYGAMGLRLQITEFDIDGVDQQTQADYLRDYLTICFSHPSVDAFLQWGFWAGAHWKPSAALFNTDWTIRPNGQAYLDLVFGQFWTDTTATTDANGQVTIRGFKGDYDIEVTAGVATATAAVSSGTGNVAVTITPRTLDTLTLAPVADSHVLDGNPDDNLGANVLLLSKNSTLPNFSRDGYLKFNLPGLSPVASARLRLRAALGGGSQSYGIGISVCAVSDTAWTETGITWNNRPARGPVLDNAEVNGATPEWIEFDVTDYVRAEQTAGRSLISLALHNGIATSGPYIQVDSRESAVSANRPQLILVTDVTAPSLTLPPNITVAATSPAGASVSFAPTATDTNDPAPMVAATPVSGSTFPIGTTTVNVSATDAAGNVANGSFTVTVAPLTSIENWRYGYFGSAANSGNGADTFDFDLDGLTNLVEFAFGLNPTQAASMQLPQPQRVGGDFVVSFTQPASAGGITYAAEWSTTLSNNPADWTAISDSDPSPTAYAFSVPIGANQKMFMRFRITSP